MSEPTRGLLDTSVIIDHDTIDVDALPEESAICAAVRSSGRTARPRFADLLIASVAAANGLPLYTRNAADFTGLGDLITVVEVQGPMKTVFWKEQA